VTADEKVVVPGDVAVERSASAGEQAGPILERVKVRYDKNDELLTVTYYFSQDLADLNYDESDFVLYNADGEKFYADRIDDVEDNKVIVEFEIDEDDYAS